MEGVGCEEAVDFVRGGHGGLGAEPRDRNCGYGGGEDCAAGDFRAAHQSYGEACVESVSGGGGIDGRDRKCGDAQLR
jgi:hypothetical protein